MGLLNGVADYRGELGQEVEVPEKTPLEVGTLKNRYGPVGVWSTLVFDGRYGLLRDPWPVESSGSS